MSKRKRLETRPNGTRKTCLGCGVTKRTRLPDPYLCGDCQTAGDPGPKTDRPKTRRCVSCGQDRQTKSKDPAYVCRACQTAKRKAPRKTPAKKASTKPQASPKPAGRVKTSPKPRNPPRTATGAPRGLPGRQATRTYQEAGQAQRDAANRYRLKMKAAIRDIAFDQLPDGTRRDNWAEAVKRIDWDRRMACQRNLKAFCEAYLPAVFYLGWSDDQLRCIRKMESVMMDGGLFTLAMPRGGGKTALCRAGIIWGTAYAHRTFPFFVGSTQPKAIQTLEFIKTYWYRSKELKQDFPEIAFPVDRIENRFHLARGQTFHGESTFIEWGSESITYPSLLFSKEDAAVYLDRLGDSRDEGEMVYLPDFDGWITGNAGTIIRTGGIDGSIRGEAEVHPMTLRQPRPDCVLLDDIQKDQKADSPAACVKMIRLVDGAVQGLAGPGERIAGLMPCTVIREGDVADTYLDPIKKPDWQGERCKMVISWPEGITDFEITMDSPAGKHWNEYAQRRLQSLRLYGDGRTATDYYRENRKEMDEGFKVSWPERYDKETEESAQQHAMNLRLTSPMTFPPEYQNIGRRDDEGLPVMITASQLAEKTVDLDRGFCPADTEHITAFVDVQNEILFYGVFATSPDFTGVMIDYGTWPEVNTPYFTKAQTEAWSLLTREFFATYPEHKDKAIRTERGKIRAPLEAKIYHALSKAVPWLLDREYIRQDGHATPLRIKRLGIDTRWGQVTDVIKRFCREGSKSLTGTHAGYLGMLPYFGQSVPPTHRQFEEYTRTKGWLFEDQINPQVKEVKWVLRPDSAGQFYLSVDVSRMKDFLMARLASPQGEKGSISLFKAPPERHELFAHHVCQSEYPEPVSARGITKNVWQARDGRPDNDYLDVCVGCLALASSLGAYLHTHGTAERTQKRTSVAERWKAKRAS